MARSFFALFPGITPSPQDWQPNGAPELLALQDVWEYASTCSPSLLFRVRSESSGGPVTPSDVIESCVGLVDSGTRWRTVFALARPYVTAVRTPQLKAAINEAMGAIMTQHPGTVSIENRMQAAHNLASIARAEPAPVPVGFVKPHGFEVVVADCVARLLLADNDVEAASLLPFVAANPFQPDSPEWVGRRATLETWSGSVLLTEAMVRLSERAPAWLFSKMPLLGSAGAPETPQPEEDDEAST